MFRKTKQSPCKPALKGRQGSHKPNTQDVPSAYQSPVSTRKKIHSQVENVSENCMILQETLSPIIGSRRQVLGQRKLANLTNVCLDPSSGGEGSEKENNAPLKKKNSWQENKVSPLEERVNMNTPNKGKEIIEDGKKQAVRRGSVVSDKENILVTNTTHTPVRKSKRIMVATKSKSVQDILKPVRKKPINKNQIETNIISETNKLSKEGVSSSQTGIKEPEPQPKQQKIYRARSLKTSSSAAQLSSVTTKSRSKDVSDSSCVKVHAAADQECSGNEKQNAKPNKVTAVLPRRVTRRSSQPDKDDTPKKNIRKGDQTPKMSGTSKRINKGVSPANINKSNRLSGKLPKKSQNTLQNIEPSSSSDSQGGTQEKSKPPVWASVKGIKITPGKRKSFRINSDTYDFPSSPHKKQVDVKRRRIAKPRKQTKKKKKPCTKLTLLTTDPSWQGTASKGMPFLSASSASTTNKTTASASCYSNSAIDGCDEASVPSNMSSIGDEETGEAEFSSGFEFEGSNDLFLGFEGETRSSFVIPEKNRKSNANESVPMTSASVLPTPVLSKHISKFIGGSSTPRMENLAGPSYDQETRTDNDSIAQCFGFSDEPEDESGLNLSPVQQSRPRHVLEVTGASDMTDGELHPATLPSRFSWSSLRPGNRSRGASTRSSSMIAQGRSVTFSTDISHQSQSKITSFTAPTMDKQHLRRDKTGCQDKLRDTLGTDGEPSDGIEGAEVSVLFDEDELMEKQSPEDKAASEAPKSYSKAPNSPEKHFARVSDLNIA